MCTVPEAVDDSSRLKLLRVIINIIIDAYCFIMTLNDYKQLDEIEQTEVLLERGIHLGERTDGAHSIVLYQIEGFYVEVFYHEQHNTITRLRSFRSVDQLRPYLEKVDISQFL